jgi:hypothetical protein
LLFEDISEFNSKYEARRQKNKQLTSLLREQMAHNSELIDQFVKYKYDRSIDAQSFISNGRGVNTSALSITEDQ